MENLKTLRRQLGVSQKDFAILMGCTPGQLAMAESGLRQLPSTKEAAVLLQPAPVKSTAARKAIAPAPVDKSIPAALKKMTRTIHVKLVRQQLLSEALEKAIAASDNMQDFAAQYQQQKALPELTRLQLEVLRRKAGEKKIRSQLSLLKCQLQITGFEAMLTKAAALQAEW